MLLGLSQEKSKITKFPISKENSNQKVPYKMATSKAQTHQRMENNCHIPNWLQSFPVPFKLQRLDCLKKL